MNIETKINLELDEVKVYEWEGDEPFELKDSDSVVGDTLNMLVDELKEHLGRDLRDIVKRLIQLEERKEEVNE